MRTLLPALARLLAHLPELRNALPNRLHALLTQALPTASADERIAVLDFLASVLSGSLTQYPQRLMTTLVLRLFRPLASSLVLRACEAPCPAGTAPQEWFEILCCALSEAVLICPHTIDAVVDMLKDAQFSLFERLLSVHGAEALPDTNTYEALARAVHAFLSVSPEPFERLCSWAPFLWLLRSPHTLTRWYAGSAVAILLRMSESDRHAFLSASLALSSTSSSTSSTGLELDSESLKEVQRLAIERAAVWCAGLQAERAAASEAPGGDSSVAMSDGSSTGAPADGVQSIRGGFVDPALKQHMVNVAGVLLPKRTAPGTTAAAAANEQIPASGLVEVGSTCQNMHSVALALCQGSPILLEGAGGAGKTALIEQVAHITGNSDYVRIHVDDQIDSKTLLGTYTCTDVPGEFKWQPGALTQAVTQGRWAVIEDLDRAPFEVMSALIPLLEQRQLFLAGRGEVIDAAPGFQLLATRTTSKGGSGSSSQVAPFLQSMFSRVPVRSLSRDELRLILTTRFPAVTPAADLVLLTFFLFGGPMPDEQTELVRELSQVARESLNASWRQVSTRDLFKWCERLQPLLVKHTASVVGAQLREDIFQSAVDCFVAPLPSDPLTSSPISRPNTPGPGGSNNDSGSLRSKPRLRLVLAIARIWDITPERAQYYLSMHKPRLEVVNTSLTIGHAVLPRSAKDSKRAMASARPFSHTKHALRLLERVASGVHLLEPVLLVGETGHGKTSVIQHLADQCGKKLLVQNLNQQSDSSDFLGGYKPVDLRSACMPLMQQFGYLFPRTVSRVKNADFIASVKRAFDDKEWSLLVRLMKKSVQTFHSKLSASSGDAAAAGGDAKEEGRAETKVARASEQQGSANGAGRLERGWKAFAADLARFERQVVQVKTSFAFWFAEGSLVKALKEGHWLLLDEINLAGSETLERLASVLEGEGGTVSLTERGDSEAIVRHPDFRLFACMNPPTDFGKKNLPPAIRGRFTELYVEDIQDPADLGVIVAQYLNPAGKEVQKAVQAKFDDIVQLYLEARSLMGSELLDGSGHHPHYSLRSLCRALTYTRQTMPVYGFQRALYEGFTMSFLTDLDAVSRAKLELILSKYVLGVGKNGQVKKLPKQTVARPGDDYQQIGGFWVQHGAHELEEQANYITTATVLHRLKDLARIAVCKKYPILIQGPTSSGKTSLVEHLAKRTGHKFIRINNHEHTDLQEYMGSYVSDSQGRLTFQEGPLVKACREGYWVVLDELNLAPSEVLEALNRLLDDNRELFIPETQETIKPHPDFLLFATQNPPGIYGGRKVLSRAFRNRFVCLHQDDIPENELVTILERRCRIAPSYAQKMVAVMKELQTLRQKSHVFAGKRGFITPRDLFRWGERQPNGMQELAEAGFMLLGERIRNEEGKNAVREVISKHCKWKLDEDVMYSQRSVEELAALVSGKQDSEQAHGLEHIAWTSGLRRLFTLVERCVKHKEPVLLVGETGCGKTTVCQLLALVLGQPLRVINCHQHTETSDLLGGLRPVRGKERTQGQLRVALQQWHEALPAGFLSSRLTGKAVDYTDHTVGLPSLMAQYESLSLAREQAKAAQLKLAQLKLEHQQEEEQQKQRSDSDAHMDEESKEETEEETAEAAPEDPAIESRLAQLAATVADRWREFQSLFQWQDGAVVQSMREGELLLIDEISLAEDAVLERLNSMLEPSRTLVLAEKGGEDVDVVVAADSFRVFATMNPGGDFGKKELSPALRNRFTEVWVPSLTNEDDLLKIIGDRFDDPSLQPYSLLLLRFVQWFNDLHGHRRFLTLRDILSWVNFINAACTNVQLEAARVAPAEAYIHGACLVLLDGLGIGTGDSLAASRALRGKLIARLLEQLPPVDQELCRAGVLALIDAEEQEEQPQEELMEQGQEEDQARMQDDKAAAAATTVVSDSSLFGVSPFFIKQGPHAVPAVPYALEAATTQRNLTRVLRALQLPKAVLLEGSPGVGKTSLLTALAAASGHKLVRINLSEQTDMMDLLGMDLPVHGGKGGQFAWCDGVFLQALKAGDWVLLDELNLASQSVLEGLNAVLDHRAQVFIPELDRTFDCPNTFRVFAAQNPMSQGGGRKGLPASFLNRFTKVHLNELRRDDLLFITSALYPGVSRGILSNMIDFNQTVHRDTMVERRYARKGSPWEFNLRDIFRWLDLLKGSDSGPMLALGNGTPNATSSGGALSLPEINTPAFLQPGSYVDLVYLQRMRTEQDRACVSARFRQIFGAGLDPSTDAASCRADQHPAVHITPDVLQIGYSFLPRRRCMDPPPANCPAARLRLLHGSLRPLEHLMKCVEHHWPSIVVGPRASGKTSLVRQLAQLTGHRLHEFAMTSSADSTELLGCFEQLDLSRHQRAIMSSTTQLTRVLSSALLSRTREGTALHEPTLSLVSELMSAAHMLSVQGEFESESDSSTASHSTAGFDQAKFTMLCALLEKLRRAVEHSDLGGSLPASLHPEGLLERARALQRTADAGGEVIGHFEWVDGSLLTALEHGHWVLLDNVNFCNPTVLDRLNPLLEKGGVLLVNECGLQNGEPRVITPHPNFRLFMAMDPSFGEVSRAMRNRCVEIALPAALGAQAEQAKQPAQAPIGAVESNSGAELIDSNTAAETWEGVRERDMLLVLNATGIPGSALPAFMSRMHSRLLGSGAKDKQGSFVAHARYAAGLSVRHLLQWARLAWQQIGTGSCDKPYRALLTAFRHAYALPDTPQDRAFCRGVLAEFEASYRAMVLDDVNGAGLLAPGMWPTLPALLDLSAAAIAPSAHCAQTQHGAIVEYVCRSHTRAQLGMAHAQADDAGKAQLIASLQTAKASPCLLACVPDSLLPSALGCMPATSNDNSNKKPERQPVLAAHPLLHPKFSKLLSNASSDGVAALLSGALAHMLRVCSPGGVREAVEWFSQLQACADNNSTRTLSELPLPLSLPAAEPAVALRLELAKTVLQQAHGPTCEPVRRYLELRSSLCQQAGLHAAYASSLPLDLSENPALLDLLDLRLGQQQPTAVPQLRTLMVRALFVLARAQRLLIENAVLEAVRSEALNLQTGSPLALSFACTVRLLGVSRVHDKHPLLPLALPLLHALDAVLEQWLVSSLDQQTVDSNEATLSAAVAVLESRDRFWDALRNGSTRNMDAVMIHYAQYAAQVPEFLALLPGVDAPKLSAAVLHAETVLGRARVAVSELMSGSGDILWRKGGRPDLPRTARLLDLQTQLATLDARVSVPTISSSGSDNAYLYADTDWKRTLIEAVCNLRYLHHQQANQDGNSSGGSTESYAELVSALESVPSLLETRLAELGRADASSRRKGRFIIRVLSDDTASLEDMGLGQLTSADVLTEHDMHITDRDRASIDKEMAGTKTGELDPADVMAITTEFRRDEDKGTTHPALFPVFDLTSLQMGASVLACAERLLFLARVFNSEAASAEAGVSQGVLKGLQITLQQLSGKISGLISLGLEHASCSPLSLAQLQTLSWLCDSLQELPVLAPQQQPGAILVRKDADALLSQLPGVVQSVRFHWLSFLNSSTVTQLPAYKDQGSAILYTPAHTTAVLSLVQGAAAVALSGRHAKRRQLQLLTDHLAARQTAELWLSGNMTERREWVAVLSSLAHVLGCFDEVLSGPDYAALLQALNALICRFDVDDARQDAAMAHDDTLVSHVASVLARVDDTRLSAMVQTVVLPCLEAGAQAAAIIASGSQDEDRTARGLAATKARLGLLRLHLLAPTSSTDPTMKFRVALADESAAHEHTSLLLCLGQWRAGLASGGVEDSSTRALLATRARLAEKVASLTRQVTHRGEPEPPFAPLYHTVHRFVASVAAVEKVCALLDELITLSAPEAVGKDERVSAAHKACARLLQSERVWQSTAARFAEGLDSEYNAFPDVTQPLSVAVRELMHGLRTLAHISATPAANPTAMQARSVLGALLSYPTGSVDAGSSGSDSAWGGTLVHAPVGVLALNTLTDPSALHAVDTVIQAAALNEREQFVNNGTVDESDKGDNAVSAALTPLSGVSLSRAAKQGTLRRDVLQVALSRAALAVGSAGRHSKALLTVLDGLFRTIVDTWKRQTEEQERKLVEEQAQYKYKAREAEAKTEEEQIEEELAEMFPDFSAEFDDLDERPPVMDSEVEAAAKAKMAATAAVHARLAKDAALALTPEHMAAVFDVFKSVFTPYEETAEATTTMRAKAYTTAYRSAAAIVEAVRMSGLAGSLPATLNETALAGHLFMLASAFNQLDTPEGVAQKERKPVRSRFWGRKARRPQPPPPQHKNVWVEGNVAESKKLERPLTALMVRLRGLLTEFPSHPILLQLIKISNRLASMQSDSPIMRLLAGMELLLRKAEEWESYASKAVSLAKELRVMSILVARWRKFELQCWPYALKAKEDACKQKALKWWFHLYGLIHLPQADLVQFFKESAPKGQAPQTEAEVEEGFLKHLFVALDEFVQHSVLGEFEPRLDMLRSFLVQSECELAAGFGERHQRMSERVRVRVNSMLANLVAYYSQHSDLVHKSIENRRGPIEQKIKDQVKLHKWDLSNYWALKDSTEKSHRKLNKMARDYEEVLRMPFRFILRNKEQEDVPVGESSSSDATVEFGPPGVDLANARKRLERGAAAAAVKADKSTHKNKKYKRKGKDKKPADGGEQPEDEETKPEPVDDDDIARAMVAPLPERQLFVLSDARWAGWMAADEDSALVARQDGRYARRLPALLIRMQKLLNKSVLGDTHATKRASAAGAIEEIGVALIGRAQALATQKAKMTRKKKAFADLTKLLRQAGLSFHHAALAEVKASATIENEGDDMVDEGADTTSLALNDGGTVPPVFLHAPLDACFRRDEVYETGHASDKHGDMPPPPRKAVKKGSKQDKHGALGEPEGVLDTLQSLAAGCESYTVKVTSGMRTVRARAIAPHKDLTGQEVARAKGMLEHLVALLAQQRAELSGAATHYHVLRQWFWALTQLPAYDHDDSSSSNASSGSSSMDVADGISHGSDSIGVDSSLASMSLSEWYWASKDVIDALVECAEHQRMLYARVGAVSGDPSIKDSMTQATLALSRASIVLGSCKADLDTRMAQLFPRDRRLPNYDAGAFLDVTVADSTAMLQRVLGKASALFATDELLCLPFVSADHSPWVRLARQCTAFHATLQAREHVPAQASAPEAAASTITPTAQQRAAIERSAAAKSQKAFWTAQESVVSCMLIGVQNSMQRWEQEQVGDAEGRVAKTSGDSRLSRQSEATGAGGGLLSQLLVTELGTTGEALRALSLKSLNSRLSSMVTALSALPPSDKLGSSGPSATDVCLGAARDLCPMLHQTLLLTQRSMLEALRSHRSALKLAHILIALLNALLARGFCRQPDEQDGDDDEAGFDDNVAGTGMGEGEGKKDVSDQIEDEEQLLGTQDEQDSAGNEPKDDKGEQQDPDEGLEMQNDFDGELHDVPDEEDKENQDEESGDEKEELDREMGDLEDDDKDVVDEKLWDEEDESEDENDQDRADEKIEKDSAVDGDPNQEPEMVGMDDESQDPPDDKNDKDKDKDKPEKQPEEGADEFPENEGENSDEDEHADPVNDGQEQFEENHNIEPMDLPDDLALDEDEKEEKEEGEDGEEEEEDMMKDDDDEEGGDDMDFQDQGEDDGQLDDKDQTKEDEDGEEDQDKEENGEDEGGRDEKDEVTGEPDNNDPENEPEKQLPQPAVEADMQQEEEEEEDEEEDKDVERSKDKAQQSNQSSAAGAQQVDGGEAGKEGQEEEEAKEDKGEDNDPETLPDEEQDNANVSQREADDADAGADSEWKPSQEPQKGDNSNQKQQPPKRKEANPFKSLGDALKKWQDRLKPVENEDKNEKDEEQLGEQEQAQEDEEAQEELSGTVQHAREDEKADGQALAPANEEDDKEDQDEGEAGMEQHEEKEEPKDDDSMQDEEEEGSEARTHGEDGEEDEEEGSDDKDKDKKDDKDSKSANRGGKQRLPQHQGDQVQDMQPEDKEDEEGEENQWDPLQEDEQNKQQGDDDDEEELGRESRIGAPVEDAIPPAEEQQPEHKPLEPEELALLREALREELDQWEGGDGSGHALWAAFEAVTSDLSQQLCEHLRMILEPMVATKLRGDYRTGKRINIKKVIPYIASQFRKDKIWLRRTKPNKRQYQVMVAIDNSASMRANGAGRLAMEALTVLCKAMTQLEVGELGVMSFGEEAKLVHAFDQPFTDDSGAYALSQFKFKQDKTQWPNFLETVVNVLTQAKEASSSSTADEQLQLVFVISDARIQQDREVVARWAREAADRRQLLVMLVVDSTDPTQSILNLKSVTYPNGKLKVDTYLESFPFPYYIILRDIRALPEIVADALRQWFEMISQTS